MSYQRASCHPVAYDPSSNGLSSDMQPTSYGAVADNSDQDSDNFGYVEFSGKGGRTCPTCNGTGRIAKHQEDELVALIPYNDQRLKPSRTKTYVSTAVFLCLLICGLIVFFLFPRSVTLHHANVSFNVSVDKNLSSTTITMRNQYNITNKNYFQVDVSSLSVEAFFNQVSVGTGGLASTPVSVTARMINLTIEIEVIAHFNSKNNMDYVIDLCTNPKRKVHDILIVLQATQTFEYLQHSEQSSITTYKYIDCSENSTDKPDLIS